MLSNNATVVSLKHVELVRARRVLERVFESRAYHELYEKDKILGCCLNEAFEDSARNSDALVFELERILSLYADILAVMPDDAAENFTLFSPSRQ